MNNWSLKFISRENFKNHVQNTISTYDKTLETIDIEKFNANIIDPIKLIFDSKVYKKSMETVIKDELVRQRDKTNSNAIGYFHQNIFKYIKNCEVPKAGFDVIFTRQNGNKIYVEMKNKHNTMNSSSSQKTFMKMQDMLVKDNNSECFLVEAIAKESQNIIWNISLDGYKIENPKIRRVSLDKFYEIVTGEKDAFYQLCMQLPGIIDEIVEEHGKLIQISEDTVEIGLKKKNKDLIKALYLLAFETYEGFDKLKK